MPGVPFDEGRATIRNDGGRVLDDDGAPIPGVVLHGLDQARAERRHRHEQEGRDRDRRAAARGPAGRHRRADGSDSHRSVDELLAERGIAVVSYEGWQAIDAAECAAGEPQGRPRIKLHRWDALLAAARKR